MSSTRPIAKYHCTQAELYAICTIGWNSYLENQPDFEAFSTLYTVPFGDAALLKVEDAKNLPDFQARNKATETAYILMGQKAEEGLAKWRALRSYIKASFPPELYKPNVEAAGEEHYNKAMTRNWGETELMFTSALAFITDNTAELTLGGMPPTFQADLDAIKVDFDKQYSRFTDFGQDEHEGTDAKVEANNAIYADLLRMFEDGQVIYEQDASKRERFIFARVKASITNNPTTNPNTVDPNSVVIAGTATDAATFNPVQGATIQASSPSLPQPVDTLTLEDGLFKFTVPGISNQTPIALLVECYASGYQTASQTVEVIGGQGYTINFDLTEESSP